jgi:hypothetical protein
METFYIGVDEQLIDFEISRDRSCVSFTKWTVGDQTIARQKAKEKK